jgi:uncharacterized protein YrrD
MRHADSGKITGSSVIDTEGAAIGTATDVIFDDVDLQPRWLVVRYGGLRHHHTAVPFDRTYVAEDGAVVAEPGREVVLHAPRVGKGAPLSPEEESELEAYFHVSHR